MKLAYLTSRYPAVSHSFIQREVLVLREQGVEVDTFSVRRALPSDVLSDVDREEAARTTSILPVAALRLARSHLRALIRSPSAYVATFRAALDSSPPGLRSALWQAFYFAEAIILWQELQQRGIRHIHAHFANVGADVAELTCAYGRTADGDASWAWSFTMHGPTEFYDVTRYRLAQKAAAADFVICISDFARSQLMGMLEPHMWDKLQIVHCGVDLDVFAPVPLRRSEHGTLRILCVGRLVPVKGQAVLLEAGERLRRAGVEVSLVFVGDGPDRPYLEQRAGELSVPVEFAGAVSQDQIRAHYADADVFCLPSFAEGVPVVLMEAMAMELPVVSTTVAGIGELVMDGESGLLVAPGNETQLFQALEQLAVDPQLRRQLGKAARRRVWSQFNLAPIGVQLANLFADHVH